MPRGGSKIHGIPASQPVSSLFQSVNPSITIGPVTFASSHLVLLNDGGYGVGQNYLE